MLIYKSRFESFGIDDSNWLYSDIPNETDQIVYLAMGNLFITAFCVVVLCISIFYLYRGIVNTYEGEFKKYGIAGIIFALVLNGLHMSLGNLRAPITNGMVDGFGLIQNLTLTVATFFYQILGSTNGAGGNPIIIIILGAAIVLPPIILVVLIVVDRIRAKRRQNAS